MVVVARTRTYIRAVGGMVCGRLNPLRPSPPVRLRSVPFRSVPLGSSTYRRAMHRLLTAMAEAVEGALRPVAFKPEIRWHPDSQTFVASLQPLHKRLCDQGADITPFSLKDYVQNVRHKCKAHVDVSLSGPESMDIILTPSTSLVRDLLKAYQKMDGGEGPVPPDAFQDAVPYPRKSARSPLDDLVWMGATCVLGVLVLLRAPPNKVKDAFECACGQPCGLPTTMKLALRRYAWALYIQNGGDPACPPADLDWM